MKTVFDAATRTELVQRINSLNDHQKALWGRMNVSQMARHCTLWEDMIHLNKKYKRPFIGLLLGKIFLKSELTEGRPMRKNSPSVPDLVVKDTDWILKPEKEKWIEAIEAYANYKIPDYDFVHPFFGKMTKEQVGYFAYKHNDHHLRQFNC